MNERRHEELARRLLETPPAQWPSDLAALRVPARPMPEQLRAKLAGMHAASPTNVVPFVRTPPLPDYGGGLCRDGCRCGRALLRWTNAVAHAISVGRSHIRRGQRSAGRKEAGRP
jgi:hypothetical protein